MLDLNIEYIKTDDDIKKKINKIDLTRDILFMTPEKEIDSLYFQLSGETQYVLGNSFNVSALPNDVTSPFLIWGKKLNLKISCPIGVSLLFSKPNNTKYIVSTSHSYNAETLFKLNKIKNNFDTSSSILYQNLSTEVIFHKTNLLKNIPTMILPAKFVLFNLLFIPTVFSENKICDNIFVIQNNEFYHNFKEIKYE